MRHLKNIFNMLNRGRQAVESNVSRVASALLLSVIAIAGARAAEGDVTIPDTGLDIAGYVTAAITTVAGVFAVVIGGYFAFLIVKKAMKWSGKALG